MFSLPIATSYPDSQASYLSLCLFLPSVSLPDTWLPSPYQLSRLDNFYTKCLFNCSASLLFFERWIRSFSILVIAAPYRIEHRPLSMDSSPQHKLNKQHCSRL